MKQENRRSDKKRMITVPRIIDPIMVIPNIAIMVIPFMAIMVATITFSQLPLCLLIISVLTIISLSSPLVAVKEPILVFL